MLDASAANIMCRDEMDAARVLVGAPMSKGRLKPGGIRPRIGEYRVMDAMN